MDINNNEIFSRIYSKVASDLANRVQNQLPNIENQIGSAIKVVSDTPPVNLANNTVSTVVANALPESSKTYNIFGYEFGIYGLIILVVAVCCIIYMIYKYFCKCDQQVVNVKKHENKQPDNKNNSKKKYENNDDSDSDNSDDESTQ